MKTKFIKGTNKQYSIREDGLIISHYRKNRGGTIKFRDLIMTTSEDLNLVTKKIHIQINNERTLTTLIALLKQHFPNLYNRRRRKNHLNVNRNLTLKEKRNYSQSKTTSTITKSYVAGILKLSVDDLSNELYLHHKKTLKFKRELCENHNLHISSFNN